MKKQFFPLLALAFFIPTLSFAADTKLEAEDKEENALLAIDETELLAANESGRSTSTAAADKLFGTQTDNFVDPKILRDFVESRGLIECRQKEGKLTLAADVRARWLATGEERNGYTLRSFKLDFPVNVFKSEINMFLDYVTPKTWVTTKLKYAADIGADGGSLTKVTIDRAFIGYDIYEKGCEDLYIELGRSKFDYMYESRIQFGSFFDGIHLFYTNKYDGIGTFTGHGGPFIVDSFTNHYAWIVEAGFKQLANTGFSVKYSFIDWYRHAPTYDYGGLKDSGITLVIDNPRYRFMVSQLILGHEKKIDLPGCKTLYLYAAVLANHDARKTITVPHYANKAWYAGFTLGKLCKACDWSVDINYQYVQAQAVPEFDLSGIGHGNVGQLYLSDAILKKKTPADAFGFTNYKGFEILALYAMTDSLTLRAKAAWSNPIDPDLGGTFHYKNFEMSVIYAF